MRSILHPKRRWDNNAAKYWQENLRPPWLPSTEDIENYKQGIRIAGKGVKNILILGATPELRDLAAGFNTKVWLMDFSRNMLAKMSRFLKRANPRKEKWVIGDWCEGKDLPEKFFDVVLGDLVFRLISPKIENIFLKKIAGFLKPSGLFIARFQVINQSLKKYSPEDITKATLALSDPSIQGRGKYVSNLLVVRLIDKNFRPSSYEKIKKAAWENIKEYLKMNSKISQNQCNILNGALNRLSEGEMAPFFLRHQKETEKKLKKFFVIQQKLAANDYDDAKYFPVYILKPRIKKNITFRN